MNPAFLKTLRNRPKRSRNPDLPAPPNLFSQAKELRSTKDDVSGLQLEMLLLKQRLDQFEQKNRRLESQIDTLHNIIRSRR